MMVLKTPGRMTRPRYALASFIAVMSASNENGVMSISPLTKNGSIPDAMLHSNEKYIYSCPGSSPPPGLINTSATIVNMSSSTMVHFIAKWLSSTMVKPSMPRCMSTKAPSKLASARHDVPFSSVSRWSSRSSEPVLSPLPSVWLANASSSASVTAGSAQLSMGPVTRGAQDDTPHSVGSV